MTETESSFSILNGFAGSSTWPATSKAGTAATIGTTRIRCGIGCESRLRCTQARSTRCPGSRRTSSSTGCPTRNARTSRPSPGLPVTRPIAPRRRLLRPPKRSTSKMVNRVRPTACCRWAARSTAAIGRWCSPRSRPAKVRWWVENWIESTVHALIDAFERNGRAELNVELCAAIPVVTITGSFGLPLEQALDVRESLSQPERIIEMLAPIVAARREQPEDDLISVLVEAEITDEDGTTHRLSDAEIYSFALLLLAAGSGTTWKQMGITLAALLQRPELLEAVRADRSLLRPVIEESLRWAPTDPMFSRWVTEDIDFFGTHLPKGSVLHICLGAANRDPERWERPDEFDPIRPPEAHVRLRRRSARLPRTTRGPGRNDSRHQRAARPSPQPAARPRRRTTPVHRLLRARRHRHPRSIRLTTPEGVHVERRRLPSTRPAAAGGGTRSALSGDRRGGGLHLERGAHLVADHHRAERAGNRRTTPLIHARDGDDYLVVASMGGAPQHPNWYLNLVANASAQIQVGPSTSR